VKGPRSGCIIEDRTFRQLGLLVVVVEEVVAMLQLQVLESRWRVSGFFAVVEEEESCGMEEEEDEASWCYSERWRNGLLGVRSSINSPYGLNAILICTFLVSACPLALCFHFPHRQRRRSSERISSTPFTQGRRRRDLEPHQHQYMYR
jgi:hypothetical protein